MAALYYLFDGSVPIGPFELSELVRRPGFSAEVLVFPKGASGAESWQPAGSFPDIVQALQFSVFSAPSASAPAAAPNAFAAQTEQQTLAQPASKLILVVDDDPDMRNFIGMSATMDGFRVVTATDPVNARGKLKQRPVDLIVTDLMMPGQGGYEFLRTLQGTDSNDVPVFVVSGSALDASTIAMIRQEANVIAFFPKPVDLDRFLGALHKQLKTLRPSPRAIPKRDGTTW